MALSDFLLAGIEAMEKGGVAQPKVESAPPPRDLLEQKTKALYEKLSALISKEQELAHKEGKKLIIVMGEDHADRGSMLAEHLLLKIAQDRKIGAMAVELDERVLAIARKRNAEGVLHPTHFGEILADAEAKKTRIIPADIPKAVDHEREAVMTKAIADLKEDGLFLMGASHLPAIIGAEPELKDKRILLLDISNTTDARLKELPPAETGVAKMLRNPRIATQAELGDEFAELPKAMVVDLVAKVTQQPELKKLVKGEPEIALKDFRERLAAGGENKPEFKIPGILDLQDRFDAFERPRRLGGGIEPFRVAGALGMLGAANNYEMKMRGIIAAKNLQPTLDKLKQDDELKKMQNARDEGYDKSSEIFKRLEEIRMPDGYAALPEADKKRYDVINKEWAATREKNEALRIQFEAEFAKKAKALGIKDEESLEAVEAGYRFNRNDEKFPNRMRPGNFMPLPRFPFDIPLDIAPAAPLPPEKSPTASSACTLGSEKEKNIREKFTKLHDGITELYPLPQRLEAELPVAANKAYTSMVEGDFRKVEEELQKTVELFNKKYPNPKGEKMEMKLGLLSTLKEVQEYNGSPMTDKSPPLPVLPEEPARGAPRGILR